MKIGRVIGSFIAVILLCMGIGFYSVHAALKNIVSEQLLASTIDEVMNTAISSGTDIILKNMPDEIRNQVANGIIESLPQESQNELAQAKEEIATDPQVVALTQKYMDAIIAGSVDENAIMPNVNKDIENIIETNFPKIADAVGTNISEAEINELAKEVANKVDAQTLLDKGINMVRTSITPQQQTLLSMVGFLQSTQCFVIAVALMVVAIAIVVFLKKSFYKWLLMIGGTSIISGGIVYIVATFAKVLVDKATSNLPYIVESVGEGIIRSISQSGIYFAIMGLSMIGVYFIIKFIRDRVKFE